MTESDYIDLKPQSNNIFEIENPQVYTCYIHKWMYNIAEQSIMWIRICDDLEGKNIRNTVLWGVAFFDGVK
jgi:hypothetical protein